MWKRVDQATALIELGLKAIWGMAVPYHTEVVIRFGGLLALGGRFFGMMVHWCKSCYLRHRHQDRYHHSAAKVITISWRSADMALYIISIPLICCNYYHLHRREPSSSCILPVGRGVRGRRNEPYALNTEFLSRAAVAQPRDFGPLRATGLKCSRRL